MDRARSQQAPAPCEQDGPIQTAQATEKRLVRRDDAVVSGQWSVSSGQYKSAARAGMTQGRRVRADAPGTMRRRRAARLVVCGARVWENVCTGAGVNACMCACLYVCTPERVDACMCAPLNVCTPESVHVCTDAREHACTCELLNVCMPACVNS